MENLNKHFKIVLLIALTVLAQGPLAYGSNIWYVDAAAPDRGEGTSWSSPFKTIQEAIDGASPDYIECMPPDQIRVKHGTYNLTNTIFVNKPVWIYGGYSGNAANPEERDWQAYPTIIDGGNSLRCLDITRYAVIDGFIIQNGHSSRFTVDGFTERGGGIFIYAPPEFCTEPPGILFPTINNCIIRDNTALYGGGVFVWKSGTTFSNCTFLNNSAITMDDFGGAGGAAQLSYPDPGVEPPEPDIETPIVFKNSLFIGNHAAMDGGAVDSEFVPSLEISNSRFSGNLAVGCNWATYADGLCTEYPDGMDPEPLGYGGALSLLGTNSRIVNTLFHDSRAATRGGAIYSPSKGIEGHGTDAAVLELFSSTITGNEAPVGGGLSVETDLLDHVTIANSIFWNDTGGELDISGLDVTYFSIHYSNNADGYNPPGSNNINADPQFVDPSNDDFHLKVGSPCIDQGGQSGTVEDFDAISRPQDGNGDGDPQPDMGVFEFPESSLYFSPHVLALKDLRKASNTPVNIGFKNGFPRSVPVDVAASGRNARESATNFLAEYSALYYQSSPDLQLHFRRTEGSALGYEIVRFGQTFRGLPVYGAEIVVHIVQDALGASRVVFTSGGLFYGIIPTPPLPAGPGSLTFRIDFDMIPAITPETATDVARTALGCPDALVAGETKLMIYDPAVFGNPTNPVLVWRVSLGGCASEQFLVDANTSEVVFQQGLAPTGYDFDLDLEDANGGNMIDTNCFNPTTIDDEIGDEDGLDIDYHSDPDAVMAWWGARYTYDMYYYKYGRSSYDADDGELEAYVHAHLGSKEPNARAASGCGIEFSNGWTGIDMVGHEFTHLVIRETSDLIYQGQSGALNEAFADIMGSMVDPNDWYIGEDRTGGLGIMRSMKDPLNDICGNGNPCGQPDKLSLYLSTSQDHGGVHTNNSIINKAFYLMAEGGIFNDVKVSPIGRERMGRIAYLVLMFLPKNAGFFDAREKTIIITENPAVQIMLQMIYGFSFTAEDACTVKNAFAAVEIGWPDTNCDGVVDDGDLDNDGALDLSDNCPFSFNPLQMDWDNDGIGDVCDADDDNDGIPDSIDQCFNIANELWDSDDDGLADCVDLDDDNDGILDDGDGSGDPFDNPCPSYITNNCDDNCQDNPNPDQLDGNNNGQGDACDPDNDGDGYYKDTDNCTFVYNPTQTDTDGDGLGDACDKCPDIPDNQNAYHPGYPELDVDPFPYQPDSDGDGIPDACDRFNFGDVALEIEGEIYCWLNLIKPDEKRYAFTLRAPEGGGDVIRIPFPPCDPDDSDPTGTIPTEMVEMELTGSDSISLWLEDGSGRLVKRARRPDDSTPERGFRFRPRCDEDYFLVLRTEPDFSGPIEFTLSPRIMMQTDTNPWVSTAGQFEIEPERIPDRDEDGIPDDIDRCPDVYDPSNQCRVPCVGDFNEDGDVDGEDLSTQAERDTGVSLSDFAAHYGRDDCR